MEPLDGALYFFSFDRYIITMHNRTLLCNKK